jgi:hypothetical protein
MGMAPEVGRDLDDVEQLRRRFEEFRSNHKARSRLPDELWAAAAKLAKRDGMDVTARALDVDRPSLQKWTDRLEPGVQRKADKPVRRRQRTRIDCALPAFVELLPEMTGTAVNCLVEVESPQGGKLRLELKSIATSQLADLIRAFAAA